MLIDVSEERLLVVSDLHLGNPFSLAGRRLRAFLEYVRREGYSLCVNGDGLEILQASFHALASHSLEVLHALRDVGASGGRVYYVVGNHDITLEHLLDTWLGDHIAPFLNVTSGGVRIRVEHGHLYDPFFVNWPRLYTLATMAAGPLLHVNPDVYRLWSRYQAMKQRLRVRWRPGVPGHGSTFYEAADMLLSRGFDAVVFGHTHDPGVSFLEGRGWYVNSGNWMRDTHFVRIEGGRVSLERWEDGRALTVRALPALLVDAATHAGATPAVASAPHPG